MSENEYFGYDDKSFQQELENDPDFCLQTTKKQKIIKEFFNVGTNIHNTSTNDAMTTNFTNEQSSNYNSNGNDSQQLCMPVVASISSTLPSTTTSPPQLPSPFSMAITSNEDKESGQNSSNNNIVIEQLRKLALFDGTFYTITKISANRVIEAKCELCEPRKNYIKGSREATSNFLKHLKVRHEGSIEQYQLYKAQKKNSTRKSITISNTYQNTVNYENNSPLVCPSPPQNTSISMVQSTSFKATSSKQSKQDEFDNSLLKFLSSCLQPLSIIESESFQRLFDYRANVELILNKEVIERKMNDTILQRTNELKSIFSTISHFCIGANIWAFSSIRFLYVTIHWINDEYQRQAKVLACRRIYGRPISDKVFKILKEIYTEYNINEDKIVAIVTNSTANTYDISEYDDNYDIDDLKFVNWFKEDEKITTNVAKIYRLPVDTLITIAINDVHNAINTNVDLKTMHQSIVRKWTKFNSILEDDYSEENEEITNYIESQFSFPKLMNWLSFYNTLIEIIKQQTNLKPIFEKYNTSFFNEIELQYINEYCIVMKPLAKNIEFLEKSENSFYGFLLPSILSLKKKYERVLQNNFYLKDMKLLLNIIIESLNQRFDYLQTINSKSDDAILAAIVTPSIKLRWFNIIDQNNKLTDFKSMHNLLSQSMHKLIPNSNINDFNYEQLEDEDFFEFNDNLQPTIDLLELEIGQYLQDSRRNIKMLDGYQKIKKVFLRHNTLISSYGAIDKLFSFENLEDILELQVD